jgi:alcohol dehydrogenase
MTSFHALSHRADVSAGDWVAVHGCGGIGLSAVNIAAALGGNVVAVDLEDTKLEMAEDLGAEVTINASQEKDVPKEVHDVTDGGANVSVDALGIADTCQNSVRSLDYFGQHVQIGITDDEAGEIPLPTDEIVTKEIEFIGSLGMQPTRYGEMFNMVEHGQVQPQDVITREVSLGDVNNRLQAMNDYDTKGIEVITEF